MCHNRTAARTATALGLLCLLVAATLRAQLDYNGPYLDECDYLFVSRLLYAGEDWPTQRYIFSSNLPLYVLGIGEQLGGLSGARAVAAALGVASLGLFAAVWARVLQSWRAGALAASILAAQAPHIFISKLATYDIVCFTLFVAALLPLARGEDRGGVRPRDAAASALLFGLAVLSKYVVILYAPLLLLGAWRWGRRQVAAFAAPLALTLAIYGGLNHTALSVLLSEQVQGVHLANSAPLEVAGALLRYGAAAGLLWLAAWDAAVRAKDRRARTALLWMLIASLPIAAFHINARDGISLYKHMVYPLAFLCPAAAWLMTRAEYARWRVGAVLLMVGLATSALEVGRMERAWPDARPVVAEASAMLDDATRVLSENPYLFRYHLHPALPLDRFRDVDDAAADAIRYGHVDWVYLDDTLTPERNDRLRRVLDDSGYERILAHPYVLSTVISDRSSGQMELYRRTERAAHRTQE